MTPKIVSSFINAIYFKPPKKHLTKNTDVYHNIDVRSLDILDLKDFHPEHNRGYGYILVVIDNISKLGWTHPLENKSGQTVTDSVRNILTSSKKTKFKQN